MARWDNFANHERVKPIPREGIVVDNEELKKFVAGATAAELKALIDSGDLTAKEIGEAQAANKAARAKANPS